ncbi:MAG: hypothetical protein R3F20_18645 [Planctomycetota bacterium]
MSRETENRRNDLNAIPEDICPFFRTKTMTLNAEYRRSAEEDRSHANTAHFWCIRSMDVHGPDDEDVLPWTCRPDRGCHGAGDPT